MKPGTHERPLAEHPAWTEPEPHHEPYLVAQFPLPNKVLMSQVRQDAYHQELTGTYFASEP